MKTIAKRVLLLLCLCLSAQTLLAQESVPFEGEMHYKGLSNIDKVNERLANGLFHNGALDITIIVKGNKVLCKDNMLHISTLYDMDNYEIVQYCELINQGYRCEFIDYALTNSFLSGLGVGYRATNFLEEERIEEPTVYNIVKTGEKSSYMGYTVDYVKGHIEYTIARHWVFDIDMYIISQYELPDAYRFALLDGLKIPSNSCVAKCDYKTFAKAFGEHLNSDYLELDSICFRKVEDYEVEIPQNIKIKKAAKGGLFAFAMLKFENKVVKYLEKNNMLPSQSENVKTEYRIDEEWDF